jgi:hypothetical protein
MKFKDELKRLERKWDNGEYKKGGLSENEKLEAAFYSAYFVLFEDADGHKRTGLDRDTSMQASTTMVYTADKGFVLGQYVSAMTLMESKDFESQKKALEWMQQAAAQGLEEAKYILRETPLSSSKRKSRKADKQDKENTDKPVFPPTVSRPVAPGANAESLTKRGFIFLEDSEWGNANLYFDSALDIDPEYAKAYVGKLCVKLQLNAEKKLPKSRKEFSGEADFKKAIRYADAAYQKVLEGYSTANQEHIAEEKREEKLSKKYTTLLKKKNSASSEYILETLIKGFRALNGYKDSAALATECEKQLKHLEEHEKEDNYTALLAKKQGSLSEKQLKKLVLDFHKMEGYKDSEILAQECESLLNEAEKKRKAAEEAEHRKKVQEAFDEACRTMEFAEAEGDYLYYSEAIKALRSIDSDYQDINIKIEEKIAECEKEIAEQQKRVAAFEAEQKSKYDTLLGRLNDGRAKAAKKQQAIKEQAEQWKSQSLCPHCGGKKGILGKCKECKKKSSEPLVLPQQLSDVKVTINEGCAIVKLAGIDWRVIDMESDKVLLISAEIHEEQPYNIEKKDITWEFCTLRKYLNEEFYNKLGPVKAAIVEVRNSNPNNPWYGTPGGNDTTDKIFLLSLDEVVKYFGDSGDLAKKIRKAGDGYLENDGRFLHDQYTPSRQTRWKPSRGNKGCDWWLRSPGKDGTYAAYVASGGLIHVAGHEVNYKNMYVEVNGKHIECINNKGVRPALWLNL